MQMQPIPNTKGVIVLGSTSSDPHVVPLFMLKLMLEENGYRVVNLRCFNAPEDFANAAAGEPGTKAIVIANNNGAACEDLEGLRPALEGSDLPVVLGGRAWLDFTPEIETGLRAHGITHFCTDFDELMLLLDQLEEDAPCLIPA